jgi:hypothetical protein
VQLAYIDEIGETGAFVARDHARFSTSPAFGYAGFIVPAVNARVFGSYFNVQKRTVFATEIAKAPNPGQWERKGASIFRPDTPAKYPQQIRVFNFLVGKVRELGGCLFYYADEKPVGTPAQTRLDPTSRETSAMQETLNRIARYAEHQNSHVMVMIDQINEKTRAERLPNMYGHILARASDFPEMKRIIEPPMHVDSVLSSNIQFADWVAACVTRAIDYQLIADSVYSWVTEPKRVPAARGAFTHESKLHLHKRSIPDFNHSEVFRAARALFPTPTGQLLGAALDATTLRKIRGIAEASRR